MRLGLRDLQEIRDGYYKVCVEVDKRYFDDSIEINFKNKLLKLTEVKIDEELALKWLKNGAKPTDTVHNILSREGILKKFDDQK